MIRLLHYKMNLRIKGQFKNIVFSFYQKSKYAGVPENNYRDMRIILYS